MSDIPIIGNTNQPSIKINPEDVELLKCKRCNGVFFTSALVLGKISGIRVGQKNDIIHPLAEHILCLGCGLDITDEYTEETKSDPTDNSVSVSEDILIRKE